MVNIIKASGEIAPFDVEKLRRSLQKVGADMDVIDEIVEVVTKMLVPGMSTHEIYRIAFRLLKKKSHVLAAKYHLKQALMKLGMSGYPFEKYFAELLKAEGLQTVNNQIISGFCVTHEVDVLARQGNKEIFVECKYHNRLGIKCDVKVALYFRARFLDIEQNYKTDARRHLEGWLVTNTRFTTDAMKYGKCVGLYLVAWDYPRVGSLKERVERTGLYPITCITNFTKTEILGLIADNVILCKSIKESPAILDRFKIPESRRQSILHQCKRLCE